MTPVLLAALLSAPAGASPPELAIWLGTRDSFSEAKMAEGIEGGVQLRTGPWSAELGGYGAFATGRSTGLDAFLLAYAGDDYTHAVDNDAWGLSLLGGIGLPADAAPRWGGPRVLAGAESYRVARSQLSAGDGPAPDATPIGQQTTWGIDYGFEIEARLARHVGLRLRILDRMRWVSSRYLVDESGWGLERGLEHQPTLSMHLGAAFGGGAP